MANGDQKCFIALPPNHFRVKEERDLVLLSFISIPADS